MGSHRRLIVALWAAGAALAAATVGCGPARFEPSSPAAQPSYTQPGNDLSKAGPKPKPTNELPDSSRQFESVEDARSALKENEQALDEAMGDEAVALSAGSAGCVRACRALASMRRSVDGVCELAGEDDAFCEEARATLTKSERRVQAAGCGC